MDKISEIYRFAKRHYVKIPLTLTKIQKTNMIHGYICDSNNAGRRGAVRYDAVRRRW